MWHLGTRIVGQLRDPEVSSLELALALIDPPWEACRGGGDRCHRGARGLRPRLLCRVRRLLRRRGRREWAVTIRCAEAESTGSAHAGAGIVGDSVPADELAETAAKLRTMLRAIGFENLVGAL